MAKRPTPDSEILAQIPSALQRTRRARLAEPHAASVRYDGQHRALAIALTNGGAFIVPVSLVPSLSTATKHELSSARAGVGGVAIEFPSLDLNIGVASLAQLLLGRRAIMQAAGAVAGASRSPAKQQAARRNGAKGGRPRKAAPQTA